jgi:hypothetical protein
MSVTEGEDKPLKHPTIFNGADVAVVTKNELADAVEFDWNAARTAIQAVRPGIQIFRLSAKTGRGMEECLEFLSPQLSEQKTSVNSDKGDGTKNRHTVGRSRHPSAEALVNRSSRNPSAL